jgi:uncharacterized protein (DUF1684 family)
MIPKAISRLAAYRERRDEYYAQASDSPIDPAQRGSFAGLTYFPERPDLVFTVEIDGSGTDVGEHVELQTSDGQVKHFVRAGRAALTVDGQPVTLAVFKDVERGRYFLPFRDGTAGKESYAGGRYLDPRPKPDGSLIIDFNYAYNPYCAYGDGWSCPIPPLENFTVVRIEAGERAFQKQESAVGDDE